jgi:hypothetical protein
MRSKETSSKGNYGSWIENNLWRNNMKTMFLCYWLIPILLVSMIAISAKRCRNAKVVLSILAIAYSVLALPYLLESNKVPSSLQSTLYQDKLFQARKIYVISMEGNRTELLVEYYDSVKGSNFASREWYKQENSTWIYLDGKPLDESWEWLIPPRWLGTSWWEAL